MLIEFPNSSFWRFCFLLLRLLEIVDWTVGIGRTQLAAGSSSRAAPAGLTDSVGVGWTLLDNKLGFGFGCLVFRVRLGIVS